MGEPDADIDQLLEEQVGVMLFDTFCEDVCVERRRSSQGMPTHDPRHSKKQEKLQSRIEDLDCWNLEHRVDTVMGALHLPPPDARTCVYTYGRANELWWKAAVTLKP